MKSNLAHEPPIPQGQVVHFPKNERKAMSNKEERYTKMPNGLIDGQIMAQLNDKAFKCLMFVMRQTIGFDRASHPIAITQFQKYCGIKKRDTVMSCIRDLEELGLIKVERTTGCLNEYLFTPDQYREKGLVPNEGSTLKGDGTSTTKR
ncbi:replication protein, partial [Acinetobacter lwoffii]